MTRSTWRPPGTWAACWLAVASTWYMAAVGSVSWVRWQTARWQTGGTVIGVIPQSLVDRELAHTRRDRSAGHGFDARAQGR